MSPPQRMTSPEVAVISQRLDTLTETVGRLTQRIEPVLDQRSALEVRIARLESDVGASHDKHRTHFDRARAMEREARELAERVEEKVMHEVGKLESEMVELGSRLGRIEKRDVRLAGIIAALVFLVSLTVQVAGPFVLQWLAGGGVVPRPPDLSPPAVTRPADPSGSEP